MNNILTVRDSDDPEARARRRLILAIEEVRSAARAAGLDVPADRYVPWRVRAHAWLWRSSVLLRTRP